MSKEWKRVLNEAGEHMASRVPIWFAFHSGVLLTLSVCGEISGERYCCSSR